MPTLKTKTPSASITATGDSDVISESTNDTIKYTGRLYLDGREILSPRQLIDRWTEFGQRALRTADVLDGVDEDGHYMARAEVAAYGNGIELMRRWLDELSAAGLPLADIAEALVVMRDATTTEAAKVPHMTDAQAAGIERTTGVLATMSLTVEHSATVEWLDY